MSETQKITVMMPSDLIKKATRASGKGLTPTIKMGLKLVAASTTFQKLRSLRGKVNFSVNIDNLRDDS